MALGAGVHTSVSSASSASLVSPAITTNLGSGIVVGVTFQGGTFTSLVDSKGNAAPTQIGAEIGGSQKVRLYYFPKLAVAGAGHTFTVNVSIGSFITFYVMEITTGGGGIVLDQNTNGDDAASPFGDLQTLTTLIANEILVSVGHWAAGGTTNPDTWTAGGSFTLQENQTAVATILSGAMGTRIVSATGTYNASWTATQATTGRMSIASFSEGASGPEVGRPVGRNPRGRNSKKSDIFRTTNQGTTPPVPPPLSDRPSVVGARFAPADRRNPKYRLATTQQGNTPVVSTVTVVFRKTLSGIGTRTGSRQVHGN